ncbi:MAG TPA: hypothetical protein VJT31_38190 [Rugosimonospora sp.]|nr:hypothetical protein [Rugosimonospora sp.]
MHLTLLGRLNVDLRTFFGRYSSAYSVESHELAGVGIAHGVENRREGGLRGAWQFLTPGEHSASLSSRYQVEATGAGRHAETNDFTTEHHHVSKSAGAAIFDPIPVELAFAVKVEPLPQSPRAAALPQLVYLFMPSTPLQTAWVPADVTLVVFDGDTTSQPLTAPAPPWYRAARASATDPRGLGQAQATTVAHPLMSPLQAWPGHRGMPAEYKISWFNGNSVLAAAAEEILPEIAASPTGSVDIKDLFDGLAGSVFLHQILDGRPDDSTEPPSRAEKFRAVDAAGLAIESTLTVTWEAATPWRESTDATVADPTPIPVGDTAGATVEHLAMRTTSSTAAMSLTRQVSILGATGPARIDANLVDPALGSAPANRRTSPISVLQLAASGGEVNSLSTFDFSTHRRGLRMLARPEGADPGRSSNRLAYRHVLFHLTSETERRGRPAGRRERWVLAMVQVRAHEALLPDLGRHIQDGPPPATAGNAAPAALAVEGPELDPPDPTPGPCDPAVMPAPSSGVPSAPTKPQVAETSIRHPPATWFEQGVLFVGDKVRWLDLAEDLKSIMEAAPAATGPVIAVNRPTGLARDGFPAQAVELTALGMALFRYRRRHQRPVVLAMEHDKRLMALVRAYRSPAIGRKTDPDGTETWQLTDPDGAVVASAPRLTGSLLAAAGEAWTAAADVVTVPDVLARWLEQDSWPKSKHYLRANVEALLAPDIADAMSVILARDPDNRLLLAHARILASVRTTNGLTSPERRGDTPTTSTIGTTVPATFLFDYLASQPDRDSRKQLDDEMVRLLWSVPAFREHAEAIAAGVFEFEEQRVPSPNGQPTGNPRPVDYGLANARLVAAITHLLAMSAAQAAQLAAQLAEKATTKDIDDKWDRLLTALKSCGPDPYDRIFSGLRIETLRDLVATQGIPGHATLADRAAPDHAHLLNDLGGYVFTCG